jgi:TubC N-terminal docking domain
VTAQELVRAATAAGAKLAVKGDRLNVTAPRPLAPELVEELRRSKAEILRLLTVEAGASGGHLFPAEAAWWRRHFVIRTVDRELGSSRSRALAQQLAFNDLVNEWHRRHGRQWPEWQCAGCEESIGGLAALALADGNRVHLDEEWKCLINFGRCWRNEAVAALEAIGIEPPAGFELL